MQIITLITALPGAVAQGLIWGIMAIDAAPAALQGHDRPDRRDPLRGERHRPAVSGPAGRVSGPGG